MGRRDSVLEESKMDRVRKPKDYIWTYEFGDEGNPLLVMIHGYGGSGVIFYKLFETLKERYHVICLDLLGMGRSSRPEFK